MSQLNTLNDDCLVPLLAEGNKDAFEEIYHRYHIAIYRNVYRLTKDAVVTEDLVQETFIRLWQKRTELKIGKSLAGWLFVISYNQSANSLKRKLLESKAKQWFAFASEELEREDVYDQQMELLEKAIQQLPHQKRRALELCKLRGKSYKEAAREMNISSHTVKEYLSGAMKAVREYTVSHPEYKAIIPLLIGLFF